MEERQEAPPPPYQSSWEDPAAPPVAEPADGAPQPAGGRPTDGARKFFGRLSKQAATISKQAGRHATKMYHKAQKEVRNFQERLQDGEPPSAAAVAPRHSADPARVASRESLDAVPRGPDGAGAGPGKRTHDSDSGEEPRQPAQEQGGPASSAEITPPAVPEADFFGGTLPADPTATEAAPAAEEVDFFAGGGTAPGGQDAFGAPPQVTPAAAGGSGLGDQGLNEMAGLVAAPAPTAAGAQGPALDAAEDDENNPERAKLRAARLQRQQERIQSKLAEQMEREMMAGMLEAEKDEAKDRHLDKLKAWEKANGDNIRSLLGNLGQVLWEGCSFKPPGIMDLVEAKAVKRIYRRAIVVVHPDKVIARGGTGEQNFIASFVYDVLNQAWHKFETEEMK